MKATELMIGDKVLVKVLSQIPDTYVVHTWAVEDYLRDLLQVKPIELTSEILEKNDLPQYKWLKIYFQGDYGNITDFSKGIAYVHELQHALRLCGRTELADNFKI